MLDTTCTMFETELEKLIKESKKIIKKISKTSPNTQKELLQQLWLEHRKLWNSINETYENYKTYRLLEWKN
jgi:hypothetical protein